MKNKLHLGLLCVSFLFSLIIPAARLGLLGAFIKYDSFEIVFNQSVLFLPLFLFSFITYFAPERVFQSWWKFARIAAPVAFVLSLIINLELMHSPGEQWGSLVDLPALILIYTVFTAGSILQIWRGFRQK